MRTVQPLPPNHPLAGWEPPADADCIADAAPARLLADLEAFYGHREPPDTDLADLEAEALATLTLKAPTADALRSATLDSQGLVDFTGAPHGGAHKLLPEWQSQPRITATTILDHTIVGEGLGTYYYFRDKTGIESHFIIHGRWGSVADGLIWQLMSIDREADANNEANSYAISIETGDDATPEDTPWTAAQVASLTWLHDVLRRMRPNIVRAKATSCRSGGLGYHAQMGAPSCWTPSSGKTCPARARIAQWTDRLVPAFVSGASAGAWWEMSIPQSELDKIGGELAQQLGSGAGQEALRAAVRHVLSISAGGQLNNPFGTVNNDNLAITLLDAVRNTFNSVGQVKAALARVEETVGPLVDDEAKLLAALTAMHITLSDEDLAELKRALPGADPEKIAQAVRTNLADVTWTIRQDETAGGTP
jgi:hypothetical protein